MSDTERRRSDDSGLIGIVNKYWKFVTVLAVLTWAGLNANTEKRLTLMENKMIDVLNLFKDQAVEERDYRKTVREEMSLIREQILELAKTMNRQ